MTLNNPSDTSWLHWPHWLYAYLPSLQLLWLTRAGEQFLSCLFDLISFSPPGLPPVLAWAKKPCFFSERWEVAVKPGSAAKFPWLHFCQAVNRCQRIQLLKPRPQLSGSSDLCVRGNSSREVSGNCHSIYIPRHTPPGAHGGRQDHAQYSCCLTITGWGRKLPSD